MKQQIPPILRPEAVTPVSINSLASRFSLTLNSGSLEGTVTGVTMNTADLRSGDLFVAMPGLKTHGAKFAAQAIHGGAAAIITDQAGVELISSSDQDFGSTPLLLLESPRQHLGLIASFVYGNSTGARPKMFATTGTNGKTSTSYLLEGILRQLGEVTGLTSTAERHIAGEVIVSRLTTPESTEMNALIARMRERKCSAIAIEVSAQALSQLRVDGLYFDVVGFTNLSHDHLDDYADLATYLRAKAELFTPERAARGVVSLDSLFGAEFASLSKIPVVTISSNSDVIADWNLEVTAQLPGRTEFVLTSPTGDTLRSFVPLLGAHMAANAGLAIAMLVEANFDFAKISAAIADGIEAYLPGRTERVSAASGPEVYVDFGHSPDAFLNTLAAVRKVTPGKVIMVFGADGDRDASKRPAMAQVAAAGCDILVITDHHPRFENPASIRKTLVDAAKHARPELELYEVSPPEAAIRKAVSLAKPGDAILWAGPGHQDYRDIEGVRTPYSARHEARQALIESGWK
jgi:UDP-N-acetylmuramoyl-L-alanyl-D-glutamate--2,6-diaminopimelate ligase